MQKRYLLISVVFLLGISTSLLLIKAAPAITIANDSTNDVEKISWGTLTYNYDKGDFKNEIDIVSLNVEILGNGNISTAIIFQNIPVYDGYHLYWVWISFSGESEEGTGAGAWFWAGGYSGTSAESSWWIWGEYGNITTFGSGSDDPEIDSDAKSLSWETNPEYWDNLANSGTWTVQAWAWASDGTTYEESILNGISYWDFYPNEDSSWESEDTSSTTADTSTDSETSSNGTQPSVSPGYEFGLPLLAIAAIIFSIRRLRK